MLLEIVVNDEIGDLAKQEAHNDAVNAKRNPGLLSLLDHLENMHGEEERAQWEVYENEIPPGCRWTHDNMAYYIERCYGCHAGVVFRPDMFYFTIYSEIAQYVIRNSEECREIFTDKPDKEAIVILQDTSQCIDFDKLITALKDRVPAKIDALLPTFSTDSERAREARYAAFAEAASPYYMYFTICCGIRKVRLEGTDEDWTAIETALLGWHKLLPGKEIKKYLDDTLSICQNILGQVRLGMLDKTFWQKMFWNDHCGSGHPQYEGWLMDVCNRAQKSSPYDLCGNVTSVRWDVAPEGHQFVVHHGLFLSKLDEAGFLVPQFCRVVFKRKQHAGQKFLKLLTKIFAYKSQ